METDNINPLLISPWCLATEIFAFDYLHPKHIEKFEEIIKILTDEERQRYIIEVPPRHGKSSQFSILLPVFYLLNHPDRKIILASYGSSLSGDFAFKVRNILQSLGLSTFVKERMSDFETVEGGGLFSTGVNGAITGRGASLLILDDPVKNMEEARSSLILDKTYEWFYSTFLTRAEPNANVVLIQTRWSLDDLAGRLLRESNEWTEIKMPAIAEENDILGRKVGEPLWEDRFDLQTLEQIKRNSGSHIWSSLYQQSPRSIEAGMFKREWFEVIDSYPQVKRVRYWDLAGTVSATSDFTAGVLLGEANGVYYVLDVKRMKGTPLQVEELIRRTAYEDGIETAIYMEQEAGSSGINTIDYYRRKVLKGYAFYGDAKRESKEARARPVSSMAEAGNIKVMRGAWLQDFLSELENFPFAEHDDQVDALSGAFHNLSGARVLAFTLGG